MTNNLTICPMHRLICQLYMRYIKKLETTARWPNGLSVSPPDESPIVAKKARRSETPQVSVRPNSTMPSFRKVFEMTPIAPVKPEDVPFAVCEDNRIRRGVTKFGLNQWQSIISYYGFAPARTPAILQKRWKELELEEVNEQRAID